MQKPALTVFFDHDRIVTKIIVEGVSESELPFLGGELSRCCGHKVACAEKCTATKFCFQPCGKIKISRKAETKKFFSEVTENFFNIIHIKPDVLAHKKQVLINRLKTELALTKSVRNKRTIVAMINYLDLEGWDSKCDNEHCDNEVTVADIIRNLSLECPACLPK